MINKFTQKDLIVLVADKNMEAAMKSVLKRHESLEVREFDFDIYVHPYHDPGCYSESHSFLRPFTEQYLFSLVLFDKQGCGHENQTVENIQGAVESLLFQNGWNNRACAVAIDPELETWVWKKSPHVSNAIGWEDEVEGLYLWLQDNGYLAKGQSHPERPKEALEAALRKAKKPRSSAVYFELGTKLSLRKCTDISFLKLKAYLQSCFPVHV